MWIRSFLSLLMLTLMLPTLAHASDYDLEQRVFELEQRALDLEWQALAAQQRAIDAEMQATTREREEKMDAIFSKPSYVPAPRTSLRLPPAESYLPPPEEPARSMRPPWLQPVDPMVPMTSEMRERMHCLGPRDCYLNQTGREGF